MFRKLFNELKWAYQRVRYGYDDRIYWGFREYFDQFLDPLKKFCKQYATEEQKELNPERYKIYTKTIKLIDELEVERINALQETESYFVWEKKKDILWNYIGKHISWYWD